jgi:subtilisin family serine protease
MKLIAQLPLMLFSLGISLAHAQSPNASLASPFGAAAAHPPPASLGIKQAQAALSATAVRKSAPALLDKLLARESNEMLVLFKDESPARLSAAGGSVQSRTVQKNSFQATRQQLRASLAGADVDFLHEYVNMPSALVRTHSRAALVRLLNDPRVAGVVENIKLQPQMVNSLSLINHPQAMATGHAGAGTTIVVLDDAADYRDPALGSCLVPGVPALCRVVEAITMVDPSYVLDPSTHGTSVAGIAARVAPGARIAVVDITQGAGGALVSDMVKGIDWAISKQAEHNIVSLNLSFGMMDDRCTSDVGGVMRDAFQRARNANILPVVAAGNTGKSFAVSYPACVGNAVVVGALYDGTIDTRTTSCTPPFSYYGANLVSCFSNGGPQVTLFAPGAMIDTGNGHYWSGTSQAAPHVAGAIAVLRAPDAAPNDTLAKTVARLTNTVATVTDFRSGLSSPRLDLFQSVNSIASDPAPTVAGPAADKPSANRPSANK